MATDESIEVEIVDVTYRSDDGRFTVAQGVRTQNPDPLPLAIVGDLGAVSTGELLRLTGRFQEHPRFGRRFRVSSFVPVMPTTADGIRRYLGSGMIPGVGKGLAGRLVDAFGAQTLDIIATQSARLRDVEGIGKQRAAAVAEAVRSRRDEADSMAFLHAVGLGPALARRILKRYGEDAARQLRDDPYLVAEQVAGIGFRTADRIGQSVGIEANDPRRAAGATLHVLARAADAGHVLLPRDALTAETMALDVPEARAAEAVDALALRGLVMVDGEDVYAPPLYGAERRVAKALANLARRRAPVRANAVAREGVELSDEQQAAVRCSLQAGLMVLTGGPGTGKTTTVRALVAAQQALGRSVLLCSPTGRAAKRLTEATGGEAKTIHRMLEWNPATGQFKRDESNPLEVDVVLVDEASMLNLRLADSLCRAIAPSSRLVLVGDVDQLPPVGAGQVLRDVIASEVGEVVRLERIFRQAQQSAIVRGAHAILRGDLPKASPPEDAARGGELFIVRATDKDAVHRQVLAVMNRIAKRYGFDPRSEVQVLAPVRRGPFGTETLNEVLQRALNAEVSEERTGQLHSGDKVMQLRNDYDKEVFNGDLGIVQRVEGGIAYVAIDGREVQYAMDDLDALSLAYASTVHKVQGS
ncbi:MAG: AAA family ATPase, partial [Myxococcota bacterium]